MSLCTLRIDRRLVAWPALAVAAVLCTSCEQNNRKPVYPARGKVLFEGMPAAGATVFLYQYETDAAGTPTLKIDRDGIAPWGVTDASGNFQLTTYLTFDGAPAGDYVVTVRYPAPPRKGDDEQGPDRLRGRYNDFKTSPLRATVEKKSNDFIFEVSGKKK